MRRTVVLALTAALALLVLDSRAQRKDDKGSDAGTHAAAGHHLAVAPDQLKWEDAKMLPPGAKLAMLEGDPTKEGFFAMRAKFPAGYRIPPHFHPCPERITVLFGTFHMGAGDAFDEKAGKALPVGAYAVMPPNARHFAWAEGETVVQIATIGPWGITYVNAADDPRAGQQQAR